MDDENADFLSFHYLASPAIENGDELPILNKSTLVECSVDPEGEFLHRTCECDGVSRFHIIMIIDKSIVRPLVFEDPAFCGNVQFHRSLITIQMIGSNIENH